MKIFKKIALVACVLALPVLMVACTTNMKSDVLNNTSDIRYNIFVGQADGVAVNLMCGLRENPYNYDGKSCKKTDFGVLTATLKTRPTENVHFTITIDGAAQSGVLDENPYNHTFMADIEKIVDDESAVFITIEGVVENMQMVCVSADWAVQYGDALDIAITSLEEEIKNAYQNRKFCAECYLKIVLDQANVDNPYYWCFMILKSDGTSKSIIFDVETGEILTETHSQS